MAASHSYSLTRPCCWCLYDWDQKWERWQIPILLGITITVCMIKIVHRNRVIDALLPLFSFKAEIKISVISEQFKARLITYAVFSAHSFFSLWRPVTHTHSLSLVVGVCVIGAKRAKGNKFFSDSLTNLFPFTHEKSCPMKTLMMDLQEEARIPFLCL